MRITKNHADFLATLGVGAGIVTFLGFVWLLFTYPLAALWTFRILCMGVISYALWLGISNYLYENLPEATPHEENKEVAPS